MQPLTEKILSVLKQIPRGTVATYGQIAAIAGNPQASRQVARILHSLSHKEILPWHRVINSRGRVSLPLGAGREEQVYLLEQEGVVFSIDGSIDLNIYQWEPPIS